MNANINKIAEAASLLASRAANLAVMNALTVNVDETANGN